jgi:hypothetical protein
MLVTIQADGKIEPVTTQTHDRQYRNLTQVLSPTEFQDICDALNEYINRHERWDEIVTASWIPVANWIHAPYRSIYEAVGRDWERACFFFGLIVWRVMMDRAETWAFGCCPRKMDEVIGLTYFRVSVN